MPKRNMAGFSITELLATLSITSGLLFIGVPALCRMHERMQLSDTCQDLYGLVQFTRQQAISQQVRVTLCPLLASGDCSTDWQHELGVFTDPNGNRHLDADETLLRSITIPQKLSITWRGMGSGNSLHFSSQGVTFVSNGTFRLSIADQERQLAVSRIGKPRIVASQ